MIIDHLKEIAQMNFDSPFNTIKNLLRIMHSESQIYKVSRENVENELAFMFYLKNNLNESFISNSF